MYAANLNAQLNFGIDIGFNHNDFGTSKIIPTMSTKYITYLNYTHKHYSIETFFGYDISLRTKINDITFSKQYHELGLLLGLYKKYPNSSFFNVAFGGLYRDFSTGDISDFSNNIGITGKIKFGFELSEGINTGFTFRSFHDLYNISEYQDKAVLYQSTICFNMEISLSKLSTNIRQKDK